MMLKRKTSRRIFLLAGALVLILATVGGLLLARSAQRSRTTDTLREEGMAAHNAGDHVRALGPLAGYLERNPADVDAMLAYARSREQVEAPRGRHILEITQLYQRIRAARPADREVAFKLLELYAVSGMHAEARDLAAQLRPSNLASTTKDDVTALRAEASARIAVRANDPQIRDLLTRLLELSPDDFAARALLTEHLRDTDRRAQALALATPLREKGDVDSLARARLIEALARRGEPGFDVLTETFGALCAVYGLDEQSAGPVREVKLESTLDVLRAASMLDALRRHDHALTLLVEGFKQFRDADLERAVARRLWMAGRPREMLALTTSDLSVGGTHSEVLIYRALALADSGDMPGAAAIVKALAERRGDFRATAWIAAFPSVLNIAPMPDADAERFIAEALRTSPDEPVLLLHHGIRLLALNRSAEAREAWERAGELALPVGWIIPHLRRVDLALQQGQPLLAAQVAAEALTATPRSTTAFLAFFRANMEMLTAGYTQRVNVRELIALTDRFDTELSLMEGDAGARTVRESILPGRVLLTAITQGEETAIRLLDTVASSLPEIRESTLADTFDLAPRSAPSLQEDILRRWEQVAPGSVRLSLARALLLTQRGSREEAVTLVERGLASADAGARADWLSALARVHDAQSDPRAKERWREAVRARPADRTIVTLALRSPAVVADPAVVDELLQAASAAGNVPREALPANFRLARAQALLAEPVTLANRSAAIDLLRTTANQEPDLLEARALLVRALLLDRPEVGIAPARAEAIQQLRTLAPLMPDSLSWQLELARQYRLTSDLVAAKSEVQRVLASASDQPDVELAAAGELIQMQDLGPAATVLERLQGSRDAATAARARTQLAGVYRSLRRDDDARRVLRSVTPADLGDPELILALAQTAAGMGETATADSALAALDALNLPAPVPQLARARYRVALGDRDGARSLLEQAIEAAPSDSRSWASLAAFLLEQGDATGALEVIRRGRTALPNDARLATMEQQLGVSTPAPGGELAALADMLERNPATRARAAGVRAIDSAVRNNRLSDTAEVARLRDQLRAEPALLTLLAEQLVRQNPPRVHLAADVISGTLRNHPSSLEAARAGTDIFRMSRMWNDMLSAAQLWQQLTRSQEADLAVAEAQLELARFDAVSQTLEPHLSKARETLSNPLSLHTLALHGAALVRDNRAAQADTDLYPLVQQSDELLRDFWLPAAADLVKPPSLGLQWLDRVRERAQRTEPGAIALTYAYLRLASRDAQLRERAVRTAADVAQAAASMPGASAQTLEAVGTALRLAEQPTQAMEAFRAALAKDPGAVGALRGVAMLVTQSNPDEAVDHARRALERTGPGDAVSQLVLADALAAQADARQSAGNAQGARQSREAAAAAYVATCEVDPGNLQARLGAINTLGALDRYVETFTHYDSLLENNDVPATMRAGPLQNNYAYALLMGGRGGADLDRAASFAQFASAQLPLAETFDTLGSVQRARGQRDQAIAAFREAVRLNPTYWTSWVTLAEILANGTLQEATEARDILGRIAAAGDQVPPDVRDRASRIQPKTD